MIRSLKMPLTNPVKVMKIGNSLRMTIPKPVAQALDVNKGDTLKGGSPTVT